MEDVLTVFTIKRSFLRSRPIGAAEFETCMLLLSSEQEVSTWGYVLDLRDRSTCHPSSNSALLSMRRASEHVVKGSTWEELEIGSRSSKLKAYGDASESGGHGHGGRLLRQLMVSINGFDWSNSTTCTRSR
jgi:hypothetical protein